MTESINELITDHIESNFEKFDYTKQSGRRESIDLFLSQHDVKQTTAVAAHHKQLEKIVKKKGLDPNEYKGGHTKKTAKFDPALNAEIKPDPVNIPNEQPNKGTVVQSANLPVIQQSNYTPEAIGAIFDGLYTGLTFALPEAKPLEASQKTSLGELWKPIFDKHIGGDHEKVDLLLAATASIGVLGGNIIEAMRKRKEKVEKRKLTPSEKLYGNQSVKPKEPAPAEPTPAPDTPKWVEMPLTGGEE